MFFHDFIVNERKSDKNEFWLKKQVEPKMARPQNKHFVKNIPTAGIPAVAFFIQNSRVLCVFYEGRNEGRNEGRSSHLP